MIPRAHRLFVSAGHIGIVIAGTTEVIPGIAEFAQPASRGADLGAAREIDEIARNRQVIRLPFADIVEQEIQRAAEKVLAPIAMPVHKAGDTPEEFARREMGAAGRDGCLRCASERCVRCSSRPPYFKHVSSPVCLNGLMEFRKRVKIRHWQSRLMMRVVITSPGRVE